MGGIQFVRPTRHGIRWEQPAQAEDQSLPPPVEERTQTYEEKALDKLAEKNALVLYLAKTFELESERGEPLYTIKT